MYSFLDICSIKYHLLQRIYFGFLGCFQEVNDFQTRIHGQWNRSFGEESILMKSPFLISPLLLLKELKIPLPCTMSKCLLFICHLWNKYTRYSRVHLLGVRVMWVSEILHLNGLIFLNQILFSYHFQFFFLEGIFILLFFSSSYLLYH